MGVFPHTESGPQTNHVIKIRFDAYLGLVSLRKGWKSPVWLGYKQDKASQEKNPP